MKHLRTTLLALAIGMVVSAAAFSFARARGRRRPQSSDVPGRGTVSGPLLADRVRTELGRIERELDIPRVHVFAERRVVVLHGDVPTLAAAEQVERCARGVPGVDGVESHLHVGLLSGDTRPSSGHGASDGRRALLAAAVRSGAGERAAPLAVKAVLGTLAERLPEHLVERLRSHLPPDVADLLTPPRRTGASRGDDDLSGVLAGVIAYDAFPPDRAPWVVRGVLGALRSLVPGDAAAVAAALPADLRHLWDEDRRVG